MTEYSDGLKLLVKDLEGLENMNIGGETSLWIHISRVADLARGGFYHVSKSKFDKNVGYDDLLALAIWVQSFQPRALRICRKHNFVFNDLDDPWQKLAFTLYSDLCEIENRAGQLFEVMAEEGLPEEVFKQFKPSDSFSKDEFIDLFKEYPSGALREFIKILMENHDPSECCGNCQSLLKIHNWRTNSYDRGYCKNQDSKYNGCGFMNLCDWCLQFNRGIPLEFPEVDGLDLNQFIIDHHNYFNSKEPERADELNGDDSTKGENHE